MQDPKGLLLGEMALRQGLLNDEQLDACVQQQIDERFRRPLGEIMIEKGFLPRPDLETLLDSQKAALAEFERAAEYGQLFGKAALAKGFVTEARLSEAVRAYARRRARGVPAKLGQVMIEMGFLTIAQFWDVLHEQGDFSCGTCKQRIETPVFRGNAVLCGNCKAPAFEVTLDHAGPKPKRRRRR